MILPCEMPVLAAVSSSQAAISFVRRTEIVCPIWQNCSTAVPCGKGLPRNHPGHSLDEGRDGITLSAFPCPGRGRCVPRGPRSPPTCPVHGGRPGKGRG